VVFQTYQPEIVIHMAAQPLVRESYKDPLLTLSTNIMGTAHMLEAARQTDSVRVVVSITSDKCYENKEWVWGYREVDRLGGHDPYSASKAGAELVISTYRDSFMADAGIALASTRAGNVIGGGDWAKDRLIPDIMRSVMDGRPVIIRNPQATRPWQHVLEPLNGYLLVAEHLWEYGRAYAEAWNFGPNDDDVKPVSWICDTITELWGSGAAWQLDDNDHPHENTLLKLDCSKAKARLGWQPRLDLTKALVWIVEWFQAYQRGADLRAITEAQIRQFAEK
jgi:CDP-glucose 4,6-dehydratase